MPLGHDLIDRLAEGEVPEILGIFVGEIDDLLVGLRVGSHVGNEVGNSVGPTVGCLVG